MLCRHKFFVCLMVFGLLFSWFFVKSVPKAHAFVPDRAFYEKRGDIVWDVPTTKKWIALTFDDGPDSTYTPMILDTLKKYHAKGTFFLIGEHILEYPDLVQREVQEGHEIENHTFTHRLLTKMSNEEFMNDIKKADKSIEQYQPSSVKMFRPPGGALNLNKPIIEALREEHYEIVLWSWHQDTKDWQRPGVQKIFQHVIKNAHNGDIVILHDAGGNRSQTVKALNIFLPELENEGYKFVTVSKLLKSCPRYQFLFKHEENDLIPSSPFHISS